MANIIDIVNELNKNIKNQYNDFKGIYLYGSYASNNNRENSDIDMVAIFENSLCYNERIKLWQLIGKFEAKYNIVFDLHPMSNEELNKNSIYYNQVVNKGLFYGV